MGAQVELFPVSLAGGLFRRAMSFAQIHDSSVEGHTPDTEALMETPSGEAVSRARVKFGIVGSVILVGAALIFVVAPTSVPVSTSIDPQSVISRPLFTSPYYLKLGGCPEGEFITDKEVCREAGNFFGLDDAFREKNTLFWMEGCSKDGISTSWNPHYQETDARKRRDKEDTGICQHKPEDLPDYAALKADIGLLTLHCLGKTWNFEAYKECITQTSVWPKEPTPAPTPTEAPDCWGEPLGGYAHGYARGVNTQFDLDDAKEKCKEFGSDCKAVTCLDDVPVFCTVRNNDQLTPSTVWPGEFTFIHKC